MADLTPEQVNELAASGEAQLVDVRTGEERASERIAGSAHIPLDELTSRAQEVDRGRPVVFDCRVGERSAMAAQAFEASGWEAHNLAGGVAGWAERGLPLEK